MWYDPSGGDSFGPRFLISAIPFILIPAGVTLQAPNKGVRTTALVLYAMGAITNGIGAMTSAISPASSFSSSPLLDWNMPLFLSGNLDTWWIGRVGAYWEAPALAILGISIAVPLIADKVLSRNQSPPTDPDQSSSLSPSSA